MKFRHQIPSLYHSLFPSELLQEDLNETKANCANCSMTRENRGDRARITYERHLKCCTFEPVIPNYFVGAILESESQFPDAAASIRERIRRREYALPIGLVPTVRFQVELNNRQKNEFGNREDWLCPYYQKKTQNCGIWKFRGAVCTTFFCQSDAGASGETFWKGLGSYLNYVEMALLEEVLVLLDFSPRQMSEMLGFINRHQASQVELDSDSLSPATFRRIWNGYDSDIEGFYKLCYRKALEFNRNGFEEMLGETGLKIEAKVLKQMRKRRERIP